MQTRPEPALILCILIVLLNFVSTEEHVAQKILRNDIKLKGVNLGGWLIAEHWMTWDSAIWQGVPENISNAGEFVTMKYLGHNVGDSRFEKHRSTWITENDIAEIAKFGLNAVRVPVGYWIVGFDNHDPSHQEHWKMFAPGALKYLDTLIFNWARKYNIAVLIDLHAVKGSQNGNDHSAPEDPGKSYWSQYPENVQNAIDAIAWLNDRYRYEWAYLGVGMLNEPGGTTNEGVLRQFYLDTYARVRNVTSRTLTHAPLLWQQEDGQWEDFTPPPKYMNVWHEWHKYTVWGYEGKTEDQILENVRNYLKNSILNWHGNWLYIGEWSFATPDSAPFHDVNRFREFSNAYMDAVNGAHAGWTYWTWKKSGDETSGRDVWSMRNLLRNGMFPKF